MNLLNTLNTYMSNNKDNWKEKVIELASDNDFDKLITFVSQLTIEKENEAVDLCKRHYNGKMLVLKSETEDLLAQDRQEMENTHQEELDAMLRASKRDLECQRQEIKDKIEGKKIDSTKARPGRKAYALGWNEALKDILSAL